MTVPDEVIGEPETSKPLPTVTATDVTVPVQLVPLAVLLCNSPLPSTTIKLVKLASVSIVPIVALPVVVIEPALPSKVIVVLAL